MIIIFRYISPAACANAGQSARCGGYTFEQGRFKHGRGTPARGLFYAGFSLHFVGALVWLSAQGAQAGVDGGWGLGWHFFGLGVLSDVAV